MPESTSAKSIYQLIKENGQTFCSCGGEVELLCSRSIMKDNRIIIVKVPTFYICWKCKSVYENGVGKIDRKIKE